MDWIETVVVAIDPQKIGKGNNNEASLSIVQYVNSIDILWESVQQLHRVIFCTDDIPFTGEKICFKHRLYDASDNNYFKFIRACFASHPINIGDFNLPHAPKGGRKYFASWSSAGTGSGDFSEYLYSNIPGELHIILDVFYDDLQAFIQKRYDHLNLLLEEINHNSSAFNCMKKATIIAKTNDPIEQIHILMNESKDRLDNDYYKHELEYLMLIFSTEIHNKANMEIVDSFKKHLLLEIDEIYHNLQDMNIVGLSVDKLSLYTVPDNLSFAHEKLMEYISNPEYLGPTMNDQIFTYLKDVIDFSGYLNRNELYVLIEAGFFACNSN